MDRRLQPWGMPLGNILKDTVPLKFFFKDFVLPWALVLSTWEWQIEVISSGEWLWRQGEEIEPKHWEIGVLTCKQLIREVASRHHTWGIDAAKKHLKGLRAGLQYVTEVLVLGFGSSFGLSSTLLQWSMRVILTGKCSRGQEEEMEPKNWEIDAWPVNL